ncbi:LamG-like jellyroll fold domain-containing protein [Aestuariibaculum suncheonense]|uniref:LamG-like jellyroll fold domain-containing protein n=1 Tax=Aestuariibaculum suncheonense TaxID=1028745 RepID=UPI0031EFFF46
MINWTFDDGNGNSIIVPQNVIVEDVTNPTPDATSLPDVTGQCSATITTVPTATDNCGGTINGTPNKSLTRNTQGTTVVTWTFNDGNGNSSTLTQNIIVDDTTKPTLTAISDRNENLDTSCNFRIPNYTALTTANDNCTVTGSITKTQTPAIGTIISGHNSTQLITITANDGNGNSESTSFTITLKDITKPSIACQGPVNVTTSSDGSGNCETAVNLELPDVSDNCTNSADLLITNNAPALFPTGLTIVTWTVDDGHGNTNTCTQNVTVTDDEDPVAVAKPITVYLSATTGTVNVSPLDIEGGSSDNCGFFIGSVTPSSFDCSNVGTNTVTYTVKDNAGRTNSTSTTVTVIDDTAPQAICKNYVVVVDALTRKAVITASNIDNGSYDACGIQSYSLSQYEFDADPTGNVYTIPVTLTVKDNNNNEASCTATVTVEPPKNNNTYLTGQIIPLNGDPASALIEATACPGGITTPRDVQFTLSPVNGYDLQASQVLYWEYSTDNGENWIKINNTSGLLTHTITNLTGDTFVRLVLEDAEDANVIQTSAEAYVRFLPPDEPPIIVSHSALDICLNESVTINAESFFNQPNGQFGEGGEFNYAQPDGWRVDGIDGFFPASGNTTTQPTWKETNSNNNQTFSGINYDTTDNSKFAMANGVGNTTTLETPVFSTIGMTSAEAIMSFNTSFYFCNGGYGKIELSFDSGNTYSETLTTVEGYDFDSTVGGTTTSGVVLTTGTGGKCIGRTDPRMLPATINLGAYTGLSGLRVKFTFVGSTSDCGDAGPSMFSNPNNLNCNKAEKVASGWAIDAIGFAYAQVEDELEWTDEEGNVIVRGESLTVTPRTPGQREYGVTTLVNGCRTDNDSGTNFVNVYTSLAYAGQDYTPVTSECGENNLQLRAYDNTRNAKYNFDNGAWEENLYVVPAGLTADDPVKYLGTGVTGQWSIVNSSSTSCGNSATFSSVTDPNAIFTADPGTYTLRWTLQDAKACYDEIKVTIVECPTIDFDGTNDYVTFRNNYDAINNLNNDFSIEVWVKPDAVNNKRTVFSRKDFGNNTNGYDFSIVNGQVQFNWFNGTNSGTVTSGANVVDTSRWYHLAVTFDGSTYTLYVDGIELNSANGMVPASTPTNIEALLGAMDQSPPNDPVNYFEGWMDELRIWNKALTPEHIRQMMNQEIDALGTDVGGIVIPTKIYGPDVDNDGNEDDLLTWNNLIGYYRMSTITCGDLDAYKGVNGRLRNITTSQIESAPLPYVTKTDGLWTTNTTWKEPVVWDIPNGVGINGDMIDWNIVKIINNVQSGNKDITVLGLLVNSGYELTIQDPTPPFDETNDGQGLWVTHYLWLDGLIDLVGESQLVQKRYGDYINYGTDTQSFTTRQFNESILDVAGNGFLERDQQGTSNIFNFNYWGSPVGIRSTTTNNMPFVPIYNMLDGTTQNEQRINWIGGYDGKPTSPISSARYWLWSYQDAPGNTYSAWVHMDAYTRLKAGLGYTLKGSGTNEKHQNYTFRGQPHNGTITNTVGDGNHTLIGNPYASAIYAREFIKDNIPKLNPLNQPTVAHNNTTGSIEGTLYFWIHYDTNNTHILKDYQAGYATYTLAGGLEAVTTPLLTEDGFYISGQGSSDRIPVDHIPVAQGFYVTSAGTNKITSNIEFRNSQREFKREPVLATTTGAQLYKTANTGKDSKTSTSQNAINEYNIQRIRFKFKSDSGTRNLILAFTPNNEASDGYDYGFDAKVFDPLPNDMTFALNGDKLIIQAVGKFDENKQYPFTIYTNKGGSFEISIKSFENLEPSTKVYIYDSLLGTYTKINDKNSTFNITLDTGLYKDRFYVTFINKDLKTLSTVNEDLNKIQVSYLHNAKEIDVNLPTNVEVKQIQLINILGQTINLWNKTNMNFDSNEIRIPLNNDIAQGSYIVNITTSNSNISKKIVVK